LPKSTHPSFKLGLVFEMVGLFIHLRKNKVGAFYAIEARPSFTCSFLAPPLHSTYLHLQLPI
jgi:hypothetical protein